VKSITYRNTSGYKYELLKGYSHEVGIFPDNDIFTRYVSLLKTGALIVSERYAWDGPSGPTWDTKSSLRASLVHDALYQLMASGRLSRDHRQRADELLRDIALEDGLWRLRAWAWYYMVRAFGGSHTEIKESVEDLILEAP